MRAQVLYGPRDLRWEERPDVEAGPGEVVVAVRAVGICGSDIPRVMADHAYSYPIVLGHEFAGVVSAVGPEVEGISRGQPCAVAPLIPCRQCEWCQRGQFSLCDYYTYIGSRRDGAFADQVVAPAANILPLPPELDLQCAALLEPAAVVLHGMRRVGVEPGDTVAVFGLGPLGLLAVQWANILGATEILAIDVVDEKLRLAKKIGAHVVLRGDGDVVARVREVTGGRGPDLVVESAGVPVVQESCLQMVRKQGRVLELGMPAGPVTISSLGFQRITREELQIVGAWNSYSAPFPGVEWRSAITYMAQDRLHAPEIVSHRVPLSEAWQAFTMMSERREVFNKVLLIPDAGL